MVTKQLSIAIAISVFIGSGIAFQTFAAAPASATRINFDQVFADATQQTQSQYVNRARKSNRLDVRSVLQETALLPNCEPLASPYADPILGKVVGRCDAYCTSSLSPPGLARLGQQHRALHGAGVEPARGSHLEPF